MYQIAKEKLFLHFTNFCNENHASTCSQANLSYFGLAIAFFTFRNLGNIFFTYQERIRSIFAYTSSLFAYRIGFFGSGSTRFLAF